MNINSRPTAVAGMFYPESAAVLAQDIAQMLAKVLPPGAEMHTGQNDFARAALQSRPDIGDDSHSRAGAAGSAGNGGDTKGAGVIAAILDLDKGACALAQTGNGQA